MQSIKDKRLGKDSTLADVLMALFLDETIMGNEWGIRLSCYDDCLAGIEVYDYLNNDKIVSLIVAWELKKKTLGEQNKDVQERIEKSLTPEDKSFDESILVATETFLPPKSLT